MDVFLIKFAGLLLIGVRLSGPFRKGPQSGRTDVTGSLFAGSELTGPVCFKVGFGSPSLSARSFLGLKERFARFSMHLKVTS